MAQTDTETDGQAILVMWPMQTKLSASEYFLQNNNNVSSSYMQDIKRMLCKQKNKFISSLKHQLFLNILLQTVSNSTLSSTGYATITKHIVKVMWSETVVHNFLELQKNK